MNTQLYWHTAAPSYNPLQTIPENRVYVSPDRVDAFVHSFLAFSHGSVVSDDARAPGVEIGRPEDTYRRVRIESKFGKLTALVTDGHLPYPYGREMTGYEVTNLAETLAKAKAAGVDVLVPPTRPANGMLLLSVSREDTSLRSTRSRRNRTHNRRCDRRSSAALGLTRKPQMRTVVTLIVMSMLSSLLSQGQ